MTLSNEETTVTQYIEQTNSSVACIEQIFHKIVVALYYLLTCDVQKVAVCLGVNVWDLLCRFPVVKLRIVFQRHDPPSAASDWLELDAFTFYSLAL